jgi:hypothetical protein
LKVDPWHWAKWTLKDFHIAYEAWSIINLQEPWERVRALSFYTLAPHTDKLKNWSDVFPIRTDKKIKQKKLTIRKMTGEEREWFEQVTNTRLN